MKEKGERPSKIQEIQQVWDTAYQLRDNLSLHLPRWMNIPASKQNMAERIENISNGMHIQKIHIRITEKYIDKDLQLKSLINSLEYR